MWVGVIAAMAEEILVFNAGVGIGECTLLWLEDGADTFVSCVNVESCKEGVVGQGGDMLGGGIVLQKMLPCMVALSVVLLKSMMMANVEATQLWAECARWQ